MSGDAVRSWTLGGDAGSIYHCAAVLRGPGIQPGTTILGSASAPGSDSEVAQPQSDSATPAEGLWSVACSSLRLREENRCPLPSDSTFTLDEETRGVCPSPSPGKSLGVGRGGLQKTAAVFLAPKSRK
ncbi:hypothetical protein AAFF_G00300940 [Aldrovandia affinis]|uniref:Uncharacterized protein n=1 Tax=Aldrovandia affinis TaxID=143900 RepID=A0AAD7SPR4_9TELE|nr:hypothetical protein AAFF_G00300940 [Aldrovandia affinis]